MSVKREAVALVGLVLIVDAVFVGTYFLAGVRQVSGGLKVAYTAVWTLATLAVVIRALSRIRAIRAFKR